MQTLAATGGSPQLARMAAAAQLPHDDLIVIKRYGAALRAAPSSTARISYVLGCGGYAHYLGYSAGWYHVFTDDGTKGWIGGARVAYMHSAPSFSCAGALTFQMGSYVGTRVAHGCLSLRVTPSRQAEYHYCVANGHNYEVTNGPIEVAGEDWIGLWSPSTGAGWSLAQYLYPA